MKTKTSSIVLGTVLLAALFPSCNAPRPPVLPADSFPLGASDLVETRSVREIRPGLTHVHIERGIWEPNAPLERPYTLYTEPTLDQASLAEVRACLEQSGYEVQERSAFYPSDSTWHYQLTAGEFKNEYEAKNTLNGLPCADRVRSGPLATLPTWDRGPYSLHIAIIDPKKYEGKIVSEWSHRAWRSSPMELALKHNAPVAINSVLFEYTENGIAGIPSGLSIVQGKWRREAGVPSWDDLVFIENTEEEGIKIALQSSQEAPPMPEFMWGKEKRARLDGINRMPYRNNELVAMQWPVWATSRFLLEHPSTVLGYDVLIGQIKADGTLYAGIVDDRDPTDGDAFLMDGDRGLILMATGKKRAILREAMASETSVGLDLRVAHRPGLNVFETHGILVRDSVRVPLWGYDAPYPRFAHSSIGWDSDGKIYLFSSLHGTPSDPRVAISPNELADVALFLGLTHLVALSGNVNSASMVVEGKCVENPDQSLFDEDRRVAEALLVVDNPSGG